MPDVPALDAAARRSLALLVAGALLSLAGCTTAEGGHSSDGGSGASRDVPQVGRDQVASGGTVRWAVDNVPRTLNAFQPGAEAATDRVAGATLPALFTLDEAARPQLNPDYLESADVTSDKPRQTVVYKLNPKAKWSSGRRIGAADFKAQWKALSGKHKSFHSARNAGYDRIKKVTKGPGPHEVKVVFRKPCADWRQLFTPLYPKSVMGHARDFNRDARTSLTNSAGPFRVKKIHKDDESVTLVRNKHWWGDPVKLKRIELRAVPRDQRQDALTHGDLDLAEVDVPTVRRIVAAHKQAAEEDAKSKKKSHRSGSDDKGHAGDDTARDDTAGDDTARDDKGHVRHDRAKAKQNRKLLAFAVRQAFEPAYTQLALNGASGPLRDERVRRAVARAIDREAIAKHALRGTELPVKPLGSHLRMIDQYGYTDSSDALGDRDVESAQSLLAEAGWKESPARATGGADAKKAEKAEKAEKGEKGDEDQDGKQGHKAQGHQKQSSAHHRAGAAAAVAPVSAVQAARVSSQPLILSRDTAGQRASLLGQVAGLQLGRAEKHDSERELHAARAAAKKAERARATADELGLLSSGAKVVRIKQGKPLTLRFVLPAGPGTESIRGTGKRIAKALTAIGVRTQVKEVSGDSYFRDHIAAGNFDMALYSWPGTAYPATDARPIFAKPAAAADGTLMVEQNYTRVGTNQIDQLFDQASKELDDDTRNDLIKRADARIWAAAGSVPLYQRPQLVAVREKIGNAGAFGFQTPRYQDIGYER